MTVQILRHISTSSLRPVCVPGLGSDSRFIQRKFYFAQGAKRIRVGADNHIAKRGELFLKSSYPIKTVEPRNNSKESTN